ncbi:MAG: undecaprenyldiphospho-muramoylpentapeptide beta-N-acetylglucosaminyltransferase [Chthoniobacterales bacterium]
MKFAIACGGTGGHLFPGLAVAEVLRGQGHEVLLFVSEKEVDARALRNHPDLAREKLPSIGLPSFFSPALVTFLRRLRASLKQCGATYEGARPDAVLGMGGFTSIAPLIAARRRGIPAFLHESNAIPGKANRLAARFCRAVLLGFDECARHFGGRPTCVTGTPIRRELSVDVPPREEARRRLGLAPDRTTLLVMGGSQGAAGINALLSQSAPHLAGAGLQVIHLAGEREVDAVRGAYEAAGVPCAVLPFCDRMQDVYPAADLAVSRAGAASLGELAWFGLPAVLIPYPHAAEDHQRLNAEIYARTGAAKIVAERGASAESLALLLRSLLGSPETLETMASAARTLAPRDAAERVAAIMTEAAQ